jgi:predicted MFS family arabinose efflux permease
VVGAAGLVLVAAGLAGAGPACVLAGAFLFGGGYGAIQNLSLVLAFARAGTKGMTTASAVWNALFDAGTAVGAVAVGAVAAQLGLPWSYVILAGSLVLALPVALASTARR